METSPLTPKQLEILFLLYRFRFLSRYHIQTLLNHKYHHRVLAWLSGLTKKGYAGRIYSRNSSDNTKPAVYYLKKKSRYPLRENEEIEESLLKRLYKEGERSKRFIDHCLFLADFYLQLLPDMKKEKANFQFSTKTDLSTVDFMPKPPPDAYLNVYIEKKDEEREYFLEIIDKGIPRSAIRRRIRQYLDYSEEEEWETNTGAPFPKVLLIAPNGYIKNYLKSYISRQLEEMYSTPRFYLALESEFRLRPKVTWQLIEPPEKWEE